MINYLNYIFILIISIIANYYFLKFLIPFLRKYILAKPGYRDSHHLPTPSGGGIIFTFSSIIFIIISIFIQSKSHQSLLVITSICIPISVIGFIDDKFKVKPIIRYIIQILTAFFLIFYSEISYFLNSPDILFIYKLFLLLFLTFSATAIVNFVNFMDGLNGLGGGGMTLIFSYIAIVRYPESFFLVGALIGFLILNWSPSKVFMGDTGSTFIGAIYAGIILNSNNINDGIELVLIATPLLSDASLCVIRRFINKQNIFSPHKQHLYQRLNQAGWSHSKVSMLYILSTFLLIIIAALFSVKILFISSLSIVLIGAYLDKKVATKFLNEKYSKTN